MLSVDNNEYVIAERYRPKTIEDIVLTDSTKKQVKTWIQDGEIPNLLLSSKLPGLGKTSLAHTLINELNAEALFINASLYPNIDILRNKIKGFAATSSFDSRAKIVILDEADFLNAKSVQPALRGFIEEFSKNCRFVLTCNYKEKIMKPIQDRLINIDFDFMFNTNKPELVKQMFLRTKAILENENIDYNVDDIKYLIKHYYPALRSIVNKIQESTVPQSDGTKKLVINKENIDSDSLNEALIKDILNNDFPEIRQNCEKLADPSSLFTTLYDNIDNFRLDKQPQIIVLIAKYSAMDSQVRDRLVNTIACAVEVGAMNG